MSIKFIFKPNLIKNDKWTLSFPTQEEIRNGNPINIKRKEKDDPFDVEILGENIFAEQINAIEIFIMDDEIMIDFIPKDSDSFITKRYNKNNILQFSCVESTPSIKIKSIKGKVIEYD